MQNPGFRQSAWLLKNGVPFHVVFGTARNLDATERQALTIVFQEFEGAEFDWRVMAFKRPEA